MPMGFCWLSSGEVKITVAFKIVETLTPEERKMVDAFDADYGYPPTVTAEIGDGRRYTGRLATLRFLLQGGKPEARAWRRYQGIEVNT